MIQFQPTQFKALVDMLQQHKLRLTNIAPVDLQGLLNLLTITKGSTPQVISGKDGLVICVESSKSSAEVVINMNDYLTTERPVFDPEMLHKNDTSQAELRFFPMLQSILYVKNKSRDEMVLHDDEGNVFVTKSTTKSHSVRQTHLQELFPNLFEARKEVESTLLKSNEARNMVELKVGDTVSIRPFADMVAEFGEVTYPIGDDKEIKLTAIIQGYTNIAFLNTASYLQARQFTVKEVLDGQEVILSDEDGVSKFIKLIDIESGEEQEIEEPIRFSRLHLIRR